MHLRDLTAKRNHATDGRTTSLLANSNKYTSTLDETLWNIEEGDLTLRHALGVAAVTTSRAAFVTAVGIAFPLQFLLRYAFRLTFHWAARAPAKSLVTSAPLATPISEIGLA